MLINQKLFQSQNKKWHIGSIGKNRTKNYNFYFKLKEVEFDPKKSEDVFKVTVESTCKGQQPIPPMESKLSYKYRSKFMATQIKSNTEKKEYFSGVDTKFLHMFKITNKGPSNPYNLLSTNAADIVVKIYVPVHELLSPELDPAKIEAFDSNNKILNNACKLEPHIGSRQSATSDMKCGDSVNSISCKGLIK